MVSPHAQHPPARVCGGCNVCCTAMRVTPLNKPAGVDCRHQQPHGCAIYNQRPDPCRQWYCMWIRDPRRVFAEHHRPDRLGVFFTASPPDPATGEQTIFAHEIHPYAAHAPEPAYVIDTLRQYAPLQILPAPQPASHHTPARLTHHGQAVA